MLEEEYNIRVTSDISSKMNTQLQKAKRKEGLIKNSDAIRIAIKEYYEKRVGGIDLNGNG